MLGVGLVYNIGWRLGLKVGQPATFQLYCVELANGWMFTAHFLPVVSVSSKPLFEFLSVVDVAEVKGCILLLAKCPYTSRSGAGRTFSMPIFCRRKLSPHQLHSPANKQKQITHHFHEAPFPPFIEERELDTHQTFTIYLLGSQRTHRTTDSSIRDRVSRQPSQKNTPYHHRTFLA